MTGKDHQTSGEEAPFVIERYIAVIRWDPSRWIGIERTDCKEIRDDREDLPDEYNDGFWEGELERGEEWRFTEARRAPQILALFPQI